MLRGKTTRSQYERKKYRWSSGTLALLAMTRVVNFIPTRSGVSGLTKTSRDRLFLFDAMNGTSIPGSGNDRVIA